MYFLPSPLGFKPFIKCMQIFFLPVLSLPEVSNALKGVCDDYSLAASWIAVFSCRFGSEAKWQWDYSLFTVRQTLPATGLRDRLLIN